MNIQKLKYARLILDELIKEGEGDIQQISGGNLLPPPAKSNIIDCDKDPFCPDWLKVESHKKGGQLVFDPSKIELYLTDRQKTGWVNGTDIQKELADKSVLNANVLDYLSAHTELIPEDWKGKYIFFWGTIYRHSDDGLFVRCLCWNGGQWRWFDRWLGREFDGQYPAAVSQV